MNPVVGIENTNINSLMIKHYNEEENQMASNEIFDLKFEDLKKKFIMRNPEPVYDMIKNNESYLTILEKTDPLLIKYFKGYDKSLYVRNNPIYDDSKLTIAIIIEYSDEDILDLSSKLNRMNLEILEFKKELNLIGKFFIDLE